MKSTGHRAGHTWHDMSIDQGTELTDTNTTRLWYMIDHRGLCLVAQKQQQ